MFFTPTLDSKWLVVHKASQYLMILLAIAMLAIPLMVQSEAEAEVSLLVLGAIGAGVAVGTLAATLWNNAWIDCPAGCPNKVQRKNQDRDLVPCDQCNVPLWQCIGNHERVCQVSGCQVNNRIYFVPLGMMEPICQRTICMVMEYVMVTMMVLAAVTIAAKAYLNLTYLLARLQILPAFHQLISQFCVHSE